MQATLHSQTRADESLTEGKLAQGKSAVCWEERITARCVKLIGLKSCC